MPKATLRFDLSDPEDARAFDLCGKAQAMNKVLSDLEWTLATLSEDGVPGNPEVDRILDGNRTGLHALSNYIIDFIRDRYYKIKSEAEIGEVG